MAVFDVLNPPNEPDSYIDPDLSLEQAFNIQGSLSVNIAPGDWVDVDPVVMWSDVNWGMSFQVCNVYNDNSVGILVLYDPLTNSYGETTLDGSWIQNNFRHVAFNP